MMAWHHSFEKKHLSASGYMHCNNHGRVELKRNLDALRSGSKKIDILISARYISAQFFSLAQPATDKIKYNFWPTEMLQ